MTITSPGTQPKSFTRLRDFIEPSVPEDIRKEVQRYKTWLSQQHARRFQTADQARYQNTYQGSIPLDGHETRLFAPFQEDLSAHRRLSQPQALFLVVLGIAVIVLTYFLKLEAATLALGLITVLYVVQLAVSSVTVLRELSQEESLKERDSRVIESLKKSPWPLYTILCPLYKEAAIVPQFVKAIEALDYPRESLQVLFLTEEDDTATRDRITHVLGGLEVESVHAGKGNGASPLQTSSSSPYTLLTIPRGGPKTKPRACNYGLLHTKGRYVVIYDAEDIPEPDQLKKAVLAFADGGPQLACVQAGLSFYNSGMNFLTRCFQVEYSTWFGLILPALSRAGFALPLGGTSNHFQASCLRALGGWDAYNVTEDCDLGMRVAQYGFKTGILASTTFEEANSRLGNWLRQRSRWIKGFMQTYLVHTRHPFKAFKKKRTAAQLSLQLLIGGGSAVFLINPLMWAGLFIYMAFRSQVESIYQILFPAPILYAGAGCLIFGNFFYIYICMLACARKEQYGLVPFCFLLPFYWLLMSVAGFKGLFQLFTKPHYWEKTTHGLHLGNVSPASGQVIDPVEAVRISAVHPIVTLSSDTTVEMPNAQNRTTGRISTTERVKAIETLPVPVIAKGKLTTRKVKVGVRDFGALATTIVASACSIAAMIYYYHTRELLLYNDAFAHTDIARSVFDSITPGLGQLGSVWLPLPHILMWPFVWNDYLWRTGLAGSFAAMPCYILTALFIYLTARRFTQNSAASFVGTLTFVLNPNILYLQSTPLSEMVCTVTLTATGYFFLRWIDEKRLLYLICAALSTFLATLARYDGWSLFICIVAVLPCIGWMQHTPWRKSIAQELIFTVFGGLGIILWLTWNKIINGNFLYFQQGPFSSQSQQANFKAQGTLFTYHNLWQAVRFYTIDSMQVMGIAVFLVALIGIILVLIKFRISPRTIMLLIFLSPFVFYVASLYGGQAILWIPGANPPHVNVYMYNVRYGAQMVAPLAIFLASFIAFIFSFPWTRVRFLVVAFCLGGIFFQASNIERTGVVVVQDGSQSVRGEICVSPSTLNTYLAQHYDGRKILITDITDIPEAQIGLHLADTISLNVGNRWQREAEHPSADIGWVVTHTTSPNNSINAILPHLAITPAFLRDFEQVVPQLYRRKGLPPVPMRVLSSTFFQGFTLCHP